VRLTKSSPPSGVGEEASGGLAGSQRDARTAAGVRTWSLALTAGLAAGTLAWIIGEVMQVPETVLATAKGTNTDLSLASEGIRNAVVTSGILGATLGACAGLAGGVVRRSIAWTVLASATGLIIGGGAGAGIAKLLAPIYYEHSRENDLIHPLIVHGGTWAGVGAVAGLALALGLGGGWRRALRLVAGCAAAALLATFIYDFIGVTVFPLAMTDRPVSKTWETRLLARLIVAVLVAAGAVLAIDTSSHLQSHRRTGIPFNKKIDDR
jgi:hypothetical protein